MLTPSLMTLKVLLPYQIFLETSGVFSLVAETSEGSFGFLPHRQDCVAALIPGILSFEAENQAECFLAVDQGVLIKTGLEVLVSVRNAIRGTDLSQLQQAVEKNFIQVSDQEKNIRNSMAKMESGFIQRLNEFYNA